MEGVSTGQLIIDLEADDFDEARSTESQPKAMSSWPGEQEEHLSLTILWEYNKDRRVLTSVQWFHLTNCDYCVAIIGLCEMSKSLPHLRRLIREQLAA